jgi:hypothetical protein
VLTGCARLLRPGGCLLVIVATTAGATAAAGPEDFSAVVAAAAGVGLGYLQHIVAVAADTDGDTLVYHATDEELLALTDAIAGGGRRRICGCTPTCRCSPRPAHPRPANGRTGGDRRD